ncbi:MAG TPA: biotin/lipoyl-containing protein [Kofleriaceae bacterium]
MITALLHESELRAPQPGWFRVTVLADHLVTTGDVIGELTILGKVHPVLAPKVRGLAKLVATTDAQRAVGYGDVLLSIGAAELGGSLATDEVAEHAVTGPVFRAPTSGRYYSRSSPDKPPFVEVGTELAPGATICLLEVMKTFNRVTYAGPRVKVTELLVADGADVNAGDPLLALAST